MKIALQVAGLLAGLLLFNAASAAGAGVFTTGEGAIRGFDPVAYFTEGRPLKGDPGHALEWNGATWRFRSAESLAAFRTDPERYAPQYGGFCAYAVSQGYTAPVDPAAWSIVGNRLYLNYSPQVQQRWELRRDEFIAEANRRWAGP